MAPFFSASSVTWAFFLFFNCHGINHGHTHLHASVGHVTPFEAHRSHWTTPGTCLLRFHILPHPNRAVKMKPYPSLLHLETPTRTLMIQHQLPSSRRKAMMWAHCLHEGGGGGAFGMQGWTFACWLAPFGFAESWLRHMLQRSIQENASDVHQICECRAGCRPGHRVTPFMWLFCSDLLAHSHHEVGGGGFYWLLHGSGCLPAGLWDEHSAQVKV